MRPVRPPGKRGHTWSIFIRNHTHEIWACDFLQLYDVFFRPIFAFFFVVHGNRQVVHFNVTRSPSDAWVAQQLREATPYGKGPRYLIRDNDGKFGTKFTAVAEGTGIEIVRIPPGTPNLNPICERFLRSVRRECLDHVVIFSQRQLRRILREYTETYSNLVRPHKGLGRRVPVPAVSGSVQEVAREIAREVAREVVAIPILGGLHHDYQAAA